MLVLSLSALIEKAAAEPGKHLSGDIKSWDELLKPERLQLLEQRINGCFGFLAFHPGADDAVVEYVRAGTLASDSGPHILALFTLASEAAAPTLLGDDAFADWLEVDAAEQPAYRLVRGLFEPSPVPPVPGIVFFERFTTPCEAVYVDITKSSNANEVRMLLRQCFSLADAAVKATHEDPGRPFADLLAVSLQKQRIAFARSGKKSMRQWLIQAYQFVGDHRADIVSVIALIP